MESELPDRFWSKVDTSGECWLWTACRNAKGDDCGQFKLKGCLQYPQRLAFIDAGGEIAEGEVMHRECKTKLCIRPGSGHVYFQRKADCLKGEPLSERFWSKVNKGAPAPAAAPHLGNCWEWTRRIDEQGYGRFMAEGVSRRTHSLAYEEAFGDVPKGLHVDHKCWNGKCVRPTHLQAVTPALNAQNQSGANRRSKTGVRGVYPHSDQGGFVAQGRKSGGGGTLYLGYFQTIEEASEVASAWRRENYPNSLMDQREEVTA